MTARSTLLLFPPLTQIFILFTVNVALLSSFEKVNMIFFPDRPFPLSVLNQLATSISLSLNHTLYSNVPHGISVRKGDITSVTFRLYTNWEGDDPLYLYALKNHGFALDHITHRYPMFPQRNTTQWQTIDIPCGQYPIYQGYHVAVGMQDDNSVNQIFGLRLPLGIHGTNITDSTTEVIIKAIKGFQSAAFIYAVLGVDHDDEN